METKDNKKQADSTDIESCREERQNIKITVDEVSAQRSSKETEEGIVDDAEVKASVEQINPDEASMDSRG